MARVATKLDEGKYKLTFDQDKKGRWSSILVDTNVLDISTVEFTGRAIFVNRTGDKFQWDPFLESYEDVQGNIEHMFKFFSV